MLNSHRLLERFLRYVVIDTAANASTDKYPSSEGQLVLGRLLVDELRALGVSDAHQDDFGLVWGTVPATQPSAPTILFNSHVDTSPEAPSANIRPRVIEQYGGGDITLAQNGEVITVDSCPALTSMEGHTLVTTDGSTLLGGDDKAGVAAIMELAATLIENPDIQHGPVRILFTCDEEIGRGAQHVDLEKAGATAGYTLDGSGQACTENENFSADQLEVTAVGNNIHPAIAKDRMVNAVRALSHLIAQLPREQLSPETTDGRDGFLHPYDISGGVGKACAKILLRDFDTRKLDDYEALIRATAEQVQAAIEGVKFEIVRSRQYRNMADSLRQSPQVVDYALEAFRTLGHEPELGAIRGGTDGAVMSEMGLPTPNLSVGQHNIHSVREFASLDQMSLAVKHAIELLRLWAAS